MRASILVVCVLVASLVQPVQAQLRNDFDLSNATIPATQVLSGGPPRDGIPALNAPQFQSAQDATWLQPKARIIGVARGNMAKAYPLGIMNWHEIVNDTFGDENILVTFCPLCGTGIVFQLKRPGDYGVSGLLYNSDVLLYDRESDSLWSQILAEAVSGPRVGEKLVAVPSKQTTWEKWREEWPNSQVLAQPTNHVRDYFRDPYEGYEDSPRVFFPVANKPAEGIWPKERILGLRDGDYVRAYPFSALQANGKSSFTDVFAGQQLVIHYDDEAPTAWVTTAAGEEIATYDAFWFAWYAFYPKTEVYAVP